MSMDMMDLRFDQIASPQQASVISHRQIMAVRLLQMPSQELLAAIARERDLNPALEADERESCPQCGAGLDAPGRPCSVCGASATSERRQETLSDESDSFAGLGGMQDEESNDPMMRVAATSGRGEGLLHLLYASIAAEDKPIAEYLIGNLDHHGYLPLNIVEDTATTLDCDDARVEYVLDVLQRMDPPGLGARGARECLLIQLRALREAGCARPLAEALVRDHLHALAFRHFREVGRELGETPRVIEAEWQFIREQLHPYPTHGFDPDIAALGAPAAHIRPDVVIRRRGTSFEAEVVERQRYDLRVNNEYQWARKHLSEMGCDEKDRQHIRGYVDQASSFISALRQRWDTMQRVSDALIEMQHDFLESGQSALKPLTRADVARVVQLHESTVSRATDGKYVLLPSGNVVPFDEFFDSSLPVKKALRELIATEKPNHPFSDEQLARRLEKQGFPIARRTIAKYREEEGILPSRLRRRRDAGVPAASTSEAPVAALAGVMR